MFILYNIITQTNNRLGEVYLHCGDMLTISFIVMSSIGVVGMYKEERPRWAANMIYKLCKLMIYIYPLMVCSHNIHFKKTSS
jgi:hypothetical protein